MKVLLVDDDEVDRLAVRRALRSSAPETRVVEATSAREARARMAAERFDCVLLDFRLPDVEGLSLLRELRFGEPPTPVVILTGSGDEHLAADSFKAGASDYLTKAGLTAERLQRSLQQALRVFEAEQETERARRALARHAHQLQGLAAAAPQVSARLAPEPMLEGFARRAQLLFETSAVLLAVAHPKQDGALLCVHATHSRSEVKVVADGAKLLSAVRVEAPGLRSEPGDEASAGLRTLLTSAGLPLPSEPCLLAPVPGDEGSLGVVVLVGPMSAEGNDDRGVLGHFTQMISVALDNLRQVRSAERAARVRDEVMGFVSHDLRGPLQVIQVSADLLARKVSEGKPTELLDRIRRAVSSANRLIEDLLDVSRLDSGRFALSLQREPVAALLEEAVEDVRPLASTGSVALELDCEPGLPPLPVDRLRILQTLANLLGNALKYTPPGGRIAVRARAVESEVVVSVSDTGCGISPAHLPHVFERFWQGAQGTKRGAGLGLFIVSGIVAAHGGRVWVESEVGRGSTFFFTLPLPAPAQVDAAS